MASYALEGILSAIASDEPWARDFRRRAEVVAVPFMDRDGVEDGDQGKNRAPHDHNRDYGAPDGHLYPECAAIDRLLHERRPSPTSGRRPRPRRRSAPSAAASLQRLRAMLEWSVR